MGANLALFYPEKIANELLDPGRETYVEVPDNVMCNLFSKVLPSDRNPGHHTRYLYLRNVDEANRGVYNVKAWVDRYKYFPWEHSDPYYAYFLDRGVGFVISHDGSYPHVLKEDAHAGDTSIKVQPAFYHDYLYIDDNEELVITSSVSANDTLHPWEFIEVQSCCGIDGDTVYLKSPLQHDYPVTYEYNGETYWSRVCKLRNIGDLVAHTASETINSANGIYDFHNYPILVDNRGSVEDTITLTFTSGTDFDASGDYLGDIGSGNIDSDFDPINPNTGTPYFTVRAAGWGGTWVSGDTMVFEVEPPSILLYFVYEFSSLIHSTPLNYFVLQVYGESV